MNYIYDIYLNFNKDLYDFFDWDKSDNIIHIKKIPIVKISPDDFKKFIYCDIKVNSDFLIQIYNKTEAWSVNKIIKYCSLFTDGSSIISIIFDSNGNNIKKSSIYINEELEILESVNRLNNTKISFKIIKTHKPLLKTRSDLKKDEFIKKELNKSGESKLNYIHFECFGKKGIDKTSTLNDIRSINSNSDKYKNLYYILKLTSTSKNK